MHGWAGTFSSGCNARRSPPLSRNSFRLRAAVFTTAVGKGNLETARGGAHLSIEDPSCARRSNPHKEPISNRPEGWVLSRGAAIPHAYRSDTRPTHRRRFDLIRGPRCAGSECVIDGERTQEANHADTRFRQADAVYDIRDTLNVAADVIKGMDSLPKRGLEALRNLTVVNDDRNEPALDVTDSVYESGIQFFAYPWLVHAIGRQDDDEGVCRLDAFLQDAINQAGSGNHRQTSTREPPRPRYTHDRRHGRWILHVPRLDAGEGRTEGDTISTNPRMHRFLHRGQHEWR